MFVAAGIVAAMGVAASAEARTVKGPVMYGPLPWCVSVGGYDLSLSGAYPEPGKCIVATGKTAGPGACFVFDKSLTNVKWRYTRCPKP